MSLPHPLVNSLSISNNHGEASTLRMPRCVRDLTVPNLSAARREPTPPAISVSIYNITCHI